MYKQLIIARKDLNMSPGKLAAQVSHASIAFLLEKILWGSKEVVRERDGIMYHMDISLDTDLFHDWITGAETKVVCRAKNKDDLLRAVEAAKELGMEEYKDYFLIYDACRTELEKESPEGTLTCIGFRPMEAEEIDINYTIKGYFCPNCGEKMSLAFHLFFVIEIESAIQILKWRGRTNLRKNFQFFPKYTLPFHMVKC